MNFKEGIKKIFSGDSTNNSISSTESELRWEDPKTIQERTGTPTSKPKKVKQEYTPPPPLVVPESVANSDEMLSDYIGRSLDLDPESINILSEDAEKEYVDVDFALDASQPVGSTIVFPHTNGENGKRQLVAGTVNHNGIIFRDIQILKNS